MPVTRAPAPSNTVERGHGGGVGGTPCVAAGRTAPEQQLRQQRGLPGALLPRDQDVEGGRGLRRGAQHFGQGPVDLQRGDPRMKGPWRHACLPWPLHAPVHSAPGPPTREHAQGACVDKSANCPCPATASTDIHTPLTTTGRRTLSSL